MKKSTVQNIGVTLEAASMHFFTSKDENPIVGSMLCYGVIEYIYEVGYTRFFVQFQVQVG